VSETENENVETETSAAEPEAPIAPAAEEPAETEAEEVESPEESAPAAEAEAPAAPAKPQRSRKHIPRAQRRQRPKPQRGAAATGVRKPIVRQPKPERERGRRQERRGVVVSNAMEKTIVVKVDTIKIHPRYKKVIRRSQKFHAHDEQNEANVGDVVRIAETRPLSKTKNWRLVEVVEAAR
jgi:small subunit ribosomal protein S17